MRVFIQIENVDIVELDVEVLVDRFQGAADADVIFQLDCDGLVGEGFEEAVKKRRFELGHVYQVAKGYSDQSIPEEKHDGSESIEETIGRVGFKGAIALPPGPINRNNESYSWKIPGQ